MKRSIPVLLVILIYITVFSGYVLARTAPVEVQGTVKTAHTGDMLFFDATGSYDVDGDVLAYTWDFGDGSGLYSDPKVSHVYSEAGNYSVSLTVDDNKGTECSRDVAVVRIVIVK